MSVSEILLALYRGDAERLDQLLDSNPKLDIFEASALGKLPRVRNLLEGDASLAQQWSPDGFTPLHLAAFFGQLAAVRWLLDQGADVAAVSRNDMRVQPLHSAAANGHVEVCNLLLESGADPNARQHGGWTPIHAAAANGNKELEDLLVEHGADPSIANDDGKTVEDLRPA